MIAAAMTRVTRAHEMLGFVRGRLDSTREVLDWCTRATFVSIAAIIALVVPTFAGINTLPVLFAFVAAFIGLSALVRSLSRLEDVLSESLFEALNECDAAHLAFDREHRAVTESTR